MSTTQRRSLADAIEEAEGFRAMFPRDCYERWEFGGSVRRQVETIGDIEHVVIPRIGDAPGQGLFPDRVNLMWYWLDAEVAKPASILGKHLYSNGYRWGEKYRGVSVRGHQHEIWTAKAMNWGSQLAIRTGPAEFSHRLVKGLLRNGRRNDKGYVWRCDRCPNAIHGDVIADDYKCLDCEGTRLITVEKLSVPDEQTYFSLCGTPYLQPRDRK